VERRIVSLEAETSEKAEPGFNIDRIVLQYKLLEIERPLWQLTEDVLERVYVYSNLIEKLKAGETAADLRQRFTDLEIVPSDLPNPNDGRLLDYCIKRLSKYRQCLISLATKYGRELLHEMGAHDLSAGLAVTLGIPPSIELSVGYAPEKP